MILDLLKSYLFSPIRWALRLVLVLSVAIVLAVVILFFVLDVNNYKKNIEAVAQKYLGQELKIKGRMGFGLESWMPSVVLKDVQFGKDPVIKAARLEIAVPLRAQKIEGPKKALVDIEGLSLDSKALGTYNAPIILDAQGIQLPDVSGSIEKAPVSGKFSYLNKKLSIDLKADDIPYRLIAPGLEGRGGQARLKLTSKGTDAASITSNMNGSFSFVGQKGELAGDAIDFWAGGMLMSILSGSKKVTKISCAVADFDIQDGVAKSRTILIDTERVRIKGKGKIDFVKGHVNLVFTPKPKTPTLVDLATPVNVFGPFDDIKVTPDKKAVVGKLGGLLLGAVNPAALALPLLSGGAGSDNPCLNGEDKK